MLGYQYSHAYHSKIFGVSIQIYSESFNWEHIYLFSANESCLLNICICCISY